MKDCRNCANAIYDETFGKRRCKLYNHDVRDPDRYIDCQGHKEKEGKK